jgi:NADH:ubiquinone oxidoreductase subunit K
MSHGRIAAICFTVGALLLLVVENGIVRLVSIVLLFTAIALGARAIATPEFLTQDRDSDLG